MEFKRLRTSLNGAEKHSNLNLSWDEEDESLHAKALNQKFTAEEVSDSELTVYLASDASDDDGDDWEAYMDMEETDYEMEVDKVEPEMEEDTDRILDRYVRKSNYFRRWSEDECGSDRDDLCCDDLFPEETKIEHEVPEGDQEATGYDFQYSKTMEDKKKKVLSEDKLLVNFTWPSSENVVNSPLSVLNPTDPLYERTEADVHQARSQKQNGVQNTLSDEVDITIDQHFSSRTSDVSFQTALKYHLKAADLFGRMCYFLPKGGQIKSVAVYWTDKRIKEDGPVGLFDDEIDKAQILDSVESRRRYYAVVECDSTDTAKFVYKDFINVFSYIGVTRKMLELRFIPDLMDFDDHLHDIAEEEPTTIGGPDLLHLISAKDLEQIGIVTHRRKPKRRFISEMWGDSGLNESLDISDGNDEDALEAPSGTKMRVVDNTNPRIGDPSARKAAFPAIKLSCGTTIVGVPLKNSRGTFLAADGLACIHVPGKEQKVEYGNNVKIHCLGEPEYMLAACAGHTLWIYPILSHVEAMAKSKNWTSENSAVYTNMFLNSSYEPNRRIWGLPSKSNIKETSCEILFATSIPKNVKVKQNEFVSQLWLGDCKKIFKHDSNHSTQNSDLVACYGSGAQYAKPLLEAVAQEIVSGDMCLEEVLIKLLETFKSTAEKDLGTGGDVLVYFISRENFEELHDGHVDKVEEDVKALKDKVEEDAKALKETIERQKAD